MTKPKYEPMRDHHGVPITCAHTGCFRPAVRVAAGRRKHVQFKKAGHNCCAFHSKEG